MSPPLPPAPTPSRYVPVRLRNLRDWFVPIATSLLVCGIFALDSWQELSVLTQNNSQSFAQWQRTHLIRWGAVLVTLALVFWFNFVNLRRQRAMSHAHRRFAALIENSEDVLAIVGRDGRVSWVSPSVEQMTGYPAGSIIGQHFARLVHREDEPMMELSMHRLQTTANLRLSIYCHIHSLKRGWIPVEGTGTAHFDTPGIEGAIIVYRDVSERESRTLALVQSEQMLNQAQNIAALGSWRYDPVKHMISLSIEAQRILGVAPARTISRRAMIACVHPDDRTMLKAAWRSTLRGEEYDLGHRIIVNGETRWVHARAQFYFDDFDKITTAVGTVQDVTAQHLAATQLSDLLEFNQSIIDASSVGIAVLAPDGMCLLANQAICDIIGASPETVSQLNFRTLPSWQQSDFLRAVDATLATGAPTLARFVGASMFGKPMAVEGKFTAITRHGQRHALLLLTDISDFDRAAQAMRAAQQLAEEANRAKSEFLANMSHEIRTPLNAVIGLAQLSLDRTADATLREYLLQMSHSANALLDIINDILDYSKIEAGRLSVECHEFGVRDITARVIGIFRQEAGIKGLEFTTEVADDVPTRLFGDSTRITQIVVNLVSNAIKFTENGRVGLRIERRPASADFWPGLPTDNVAQTTLALNFIVTDTGIGMSDETLQSLFRPFKQADGSTTRRYGGTGLGLTISRRLAELMHGRIEVSSQPGKGSRFVLALPLTPGATNVSAVAESTAPEPDIGQRARAIAGARILLVEDDPINQMVLARLLTRARLQVTVAHHGREALDALQQALSNQAPAFDAVLMDLQMPVMDGFAATRAIRADARWATLPIIAITASVLAHDETSCRDAGMTGYVAKPVMPGALIDLLVAQITPNRPSPAGINLPHTPEQQTPPPIDSGSRRDRLVALHQRLLDNEFIAIAEFNGIRALLDTLDDPRAGRLQAAISRYDYAQAQVILAELLADLPATAPATASVTPSAQSAPP